MRASCESISFIHQNNVEGGRLRDEPRLASGFHAAILFSRQRSRGLFWSGLVLACENSPSFIASSPIGVERFRRLAMSMHVAPSRRHFRQVDRKVNAIRLVHVMKGTNEKYEFKEDYISTTFNCWNRGFVLISPSSRLPESAVYYNRS